ncbi:MAG: hypothetical protein ACE5JD_15745 [Candidatus Methylomirabilia bacterium]
MIPTLLFQLAAGIYMGGWYSGEQSAHPFLYGIWGGTVEYRIDPVGIQADVSVTTIQPGNAVVDVTQVGLSPILYLSRGPASPFLRAEFGWRRYLLWHRDDSKTTEAGAYLGAGTGVRVPSGRLAVRPEVRWLHSSFDHGVPTLARSQNDLVFDIALEFDLWR